MSAKRPTKRRDVDVSQHPPKRRSVGKTELEDPEPVTDADVCGATGCDVCTNDDET